VTKECGAGSESETELVLWGVGMQCVWMQCVCMQGGIVHLV
jgi:hypothetical protein